MSIWGRPVRLLGKDLTPTIKVLNATVGGYRGGMLKVNGTVVTDSAPNTYNYGNIYGNNIETLFATNGKYTSTTAPLFARSEVNWGKSETAPDGDCYQAFSRILSGTNAYALCTTPNDGKKRTICVLLSGTTWTNFSGSLSGFTFSVDGDAERKTLNQMIDAKIIDPIVVLYSSHNDYRSAFQNFTNLLSGGAIYNSYPYGIVYFTLLGGHCITDFQFYSPNNSATYQSHSDDGLMFTWFDWELFKIQYSG